MEYPDNIIEKIKEKDVDIISVDAAKLAAEAGNIRTVNVVLIGVLSKSLSVPQEEWESVIASTVPAKVVDVNINAFRIGRNI